MGRILVVSSVMVVFRLWEKTAHAAGKSRTAHAEFRRKSFVTMGNLTP